jgi:hypothetical protein
MGFLLTAVIAASTAMSFAPPARASHQELTWNDDGATFATFGPNEAVTITLGFIEFACDTFFHTADIYIVDAVPVNGTQLHDVGGVENTVFGAAAGLFSDTIGFTKPTGQLDSGTYTVVYDECQDGKYDSNVDKVFPNAFAVVIPADVPPLSPLIQGVKSAAKNEAIEWQKTIAAYELLLNLEKLEIVLKCLTFDVTACVDAFATDVIVGGLGDVLPGVSAISPVDKVKGEAKDAANDMYKHWEAIAADPPDPAYQQITRLEPIAPFVAAGSPLDQAMIRFGRAVAIQSVIAEAVLHAMERYQGADAAGDGAWALVHARAVERYSRLLAAQIARTNDALAALQAALTADPRDFDAIAAFATSERARILGSGLSDAELATLASLGITGEQVGAAVGAIDAFQPAVFSEAGFDDTFQGQIAADQAAVAELEALAAAMIGVVDALQADPQVPNDRPLADAGGPYAGSLGTPLLLDGSGSTDPAGTIAALAWDLDGDAVFDDAVGPSPSSSIASGGDGLVGLEIVDGDGNAGVDYALLAVSDPNQAPTIDAYAPIDTVPTLIVADPAAFEVTATDADLDPVSISWELDGDAVGVGPTFAITPLAGDVGIHLLEAVVSDGSPGRTARHAWNLLVSMADDDDDGWPVDVDCDDADADVNPGTFEIRGNLKDDDCFAASTDVITDIPATGGDGTTIVPYLSSGWRYLVVANYAGDGFETPVFDDSLWSSGTAPFASDTFGCGMTLGQTYWPLGTDVLVRRHFDLPAGSANVRIRVVVDNNVQVFLNGVDVSGGVIPHSFCPGYGSPFLFTVPDAALATGDNVLAVRGQDFGGFSYLDVEVMADTPDVLVPPGTTGLQATATATANLVRNFSWSIDKLATPASWDLFEGDTGTSDYAVTLDRTEARGDGSVEGEICATNSGPVPTEGLSIAASVHAGSPASAAAVATLAVDVSGNPILDPAESACYPYFASLPDGSAHWGDRYTTIADVTITNHALASGAFGPQALASDALTEDEPSPTSSVTVTDPDDPGGPATYDSDAVRTYARTFDCADAGVQDAPATIQEMGAADAALVIVACHTMAVTSSVATIVERAHGWAIDKTANMDDLVLATNQAFPVEYRVTLTDTVEERGRAGGSVSIHNPAPVATVIAAVDEVIADVGAVDVDCGAPFPVTIPPAATLTCSFESVVPSPADTTGIANVSRLRVDLGPSGTSEDNGLQLISASAPVSFRGGGTAEVDDCVDVDDSLKGALGSVCAADSPMTLVYILDVGPYSTSGLRSVVNTATLTARSTGATASDSHTVLADVPAGGCTLTIGYWKTHAGSGPQRDMVSPLLPIWLGDAGGETSVEVSTPHQAIELLRMADSSANGLNRLAGQLVAAKLNFGAGADGSAVATTVMAADAFLTTHATSSWKKLSKADKSSVTTLGATLDQYNKGLTGPGHCVE